MAQHAVPFLLMRGGTSRGPYFLRSDLPQDLDHLSRVLIAAVGAGHPLNIDGVGGGAAVTTKVAMLSKSDDPEIDIDYFFGQVAVEEHLVDYRPTCGNILTGVGPAAIEMGLVKPQGDETIVRVKAVNTGARIEEVVQTPGGTVRYDGDASIDGVPGTAAPVLLNFRDVVGSKSGKLLPTGQASEEINGIEVTCIDVAMPMCIARAEDFGLTGYETAAELDANGAFYERMEPIRIEAGRRMGFGDVTKSVTPKFGIVSKARNGGAFNARYFMPWKCHPSLAVTGSQCLASCALVPGTVAYDLMETPVSPALMMIEHPMGGMQVTMTFKPEGNHGVTIEAAGLVRTARLLARGEIMIPEAAWSS